MPIQSQGRKAVGQKKGEASKQAMRENTVGPAHLPCKLGRRLGKGAGEWLAMVIEGLWMGKGDGAYTHFLSPLQKL